MTRSRRLLEIAIFAAAGAALASIAALLATPLAAAVAGALLGLLVAVTRNGHIRLTGISKRLDELKEHHAQLDEHHTQLDEHHTQLEEQHTQLGQVFGQLVDSVQSVQASVEENARGVGDQVTRAVEPVRQAVTSMHEASKHRHRQLEAMASLYALVDMRGLAPLTDGFTVLPDLLHKYIGEILHRRPSLVVECGSGLSTVWAAYALERCDHGRVVALENDEGYAAKTRTLVAAHGLSHRAEIRLAPIRDVAVRDRVRPWYDPDQIADLVGVDVLLVDGPVGSLAEHSRYPALPLFRDRLSPGALVLLDDTRRPEESDIVEWWTKEWPELDLEVLLHERGTALWRVPAPER